MIDRPAFDPDVLARLAAAIEVEIETRAGPGATAHRTVIWVVVEDGQALIRTVRGPRSRWYREALAHPHVTLLADGASIPARVVPAGDAESVARCSFGLARKYASDPSLPAMLAPGVLDTTLRLEPT